MHPDEHLVVGWVRDCCRHSATFKGRCNQPKASWTRERFRSRQTELGSARLASTIGKRFRRATCLRPAARSPLRSLDPQPSCEARLQPTRESSLSTLRGATSHTHCICRVSRPPRGGCSYAPTQTPAPACVPGARLASLAVRALEHVGRRPASL